MTKGLEPLTRVAVGPFYHMKNDFGAVGDGVANDAPAFQAALDRFKYDSAIKGGRIFVPAGTYNIGTGLTYEGNFDHSFVMQGDTQGEGGVIDGPVLKYTGSAGGTLLLLKGANWLTFEHLQFQGNGLALIDVDVQFDAARSMSSFDCTWSHCSFHGATGTDSTLMRWGTSNTASAEHRALDCRFTYHNTPGNTYYGIGTTGSANVKNHVIERCRFIGLRYGVNFSNSGYHRISGCGFSNQTIADVKVSSSQVTIRDSSSEGSAMFVTDGATNITGSLLIEGCYWHGVTINDDFVIDYDGQLTIIGNDFYNNKTPTLKTFTVDAGTNVFTSTAHGFSGGDRVNVSSTGTLPAPLAASTNYYVQAGETANTFTLSAIEGGTIIDITTTGTGTHSVFRPTEPAIRSGLTWTGDPVRGSVVSLNNLFTRPAGSPVMDYVPVYTGSDKPTSSLMQFGASDGHSNPTLMRGLQLVSLCDKSRDISSGIDINFRPRITGHLTYLMGISTTAVQGKNLRGTKTFSSSGTATVTFNATEPDANYFIQISKDAAEDIWWSSPSTTGFTLNSSNPTSTATVHWFIVR